MYKLERQGFWLWRTVRLVADAKLTPADFDAIAKALNTKPMTARKLAPVAARRAENEQLVVTSFNGEETRNTAAPGDFVVTLLNTRGVAVKDRDGNVNRYVIKPEKFDQLYEKTDRHSEHGDVFKPKNAAPVDVLAFRGGFDIVAPWGERQSGTSGYLLRNGDDVYGNQQSTFDDTYVIAV